MDDLEEKFIEQLILEKKIDRKKVLEQIELCTRLTSMKLNMPFSDVYNVIHSIDYLSKCLRGKCESLTLEKCRESCHCFELDGKCYPRRFSDIDKMNEDPDKYIEGLSTEKLKEVVKLASYIYFNFDDGGMIDNTFDALQYHLNKRLGIRKRQHEKIGALPIEKLRVNLPYPMPSLDKVKPGSHELYSYLSYASLKNINIMWSHKLDGTSGLCVYKDGKVSKIYTRGDGAIGGDVTYLKEYIKFPVITDTKYKNIVVRGEFILPKKIWKEKYASSEGVIGANGKVPLRSFEGNYSNARSFVNSKINSGHITSGISDIHFVVYEIVNIGSGTDEIPSPMEYLSILNYLGFEVVSYNSFYKINEKTATKTNEIPSIFEIMTIYKTQRETSEYNIDGLVLRYDISNVIATKLKNPTNAVAFKMKLEEQMRKTKVLSIEWRISRFGRYIPVVQYESVYIDGVRLHRASAFNAAHVRDWCLGKGSIIKIIRSGDVIPTIIDVEINEKIEPIFPPPTPSWHWNGPNIVLDDPDSNRTVQIQRMLHFFVTIGVPRLRDKTLEKLWDAGYKDIKAITNAKPSDFIKIKGIGKKTSEAHYDNIHTVMRKTRIDRFIPASTTLSIGIGRKIIKTVMGYYPKLMKDDSSTLKKELKRRNIPNVGPKRIENISENLPKLKEFLFSLNREDIEYAIKQDEDRREMIRKAGFNPKIRGKIFVFTGFFGRTDFELEDYIYDNMGSLSSVMSKSVTAVVSANILESSGKAIMAQKLNIPVYTLEEFVKKFDIPYKKYQDEPEEEIKEEETNNFIDMDTLDEEEW